MLVVSQERYGGPGVLRLRERTRPVPSAHRRASCTRIGDVVVDLRPA
ncbi:hypothetical protein [Tersicoccus solisilvae]|nr:hypothetical protein [Tersicoccus solisilvae]